MDARAGQPPRSGPHTGPDCRFGILLLLAFALGRAVPILLGGWAVGVLEAMKPLARHQRAFEILGGIALVLSGLYLLNAFFLLIPELAV